MRVRFLQVRPFYIMMNYQDEDELQERRQKEKEKKQRRQDRRRKQDIPDED